jgi:hypothetical protein
LAAYVDELPEVPTAEKIEKQVTMEKVAARKNTPRQNRNGCREPALTEDCLFMDFDLVLRIGTLTKKRLALIRLG